MTVTVRCNRLLPLYFGRCPQGTHCLRKRRWQVFNDGFSRFRRFPRLVVTSSPTRPYGDGTINPSALCRLLTNIGKRPGNRKFTSPFQAATREYGAPRRSSANHHQEPLPSDTLTACMPWSISLATCAPAFILHDDCQYAHLRRSIGLSLL